MSTDLVKSHDQSPPPPLMIENRFPAVEEGEDVQLCRTPTSEECRIPVFRTPPPAPRKKRRAPAPPMLIGRRQRLKPIVVDEKEIAEFFRSCFDQIIAANKNRL
ncbi:hypothetical protein Dimus_021305 [Dionaea muscipula]